MEILIFATGYPFGEMSDIIHHECGIALVRMLKPLEYYLSVYGTSFYGLNKLHLLMQKQHNRGQDGAGIAVIKFDMKPGQRYINNERSHADAPIKDIFMRIGQVVRDKEERYPDGIRDIPWLKENIDMYGELYLGHLRYGTFGGNTSASLHPFIRENNWMTKNLVIAGNFNMTNVDELFEKLIDLGQYPVETSDTITILEKIGHFLDEENERLYRKYKRQELPKRQISREIATNLDIQSILRNSVKTWDGGYVIAGMFGHGDAFVIRDPSGIRPAFFYRDDEVVAVASERPALQTAFNVCDPDVIELKPGHALIIKKNGSVDLKQIARPHEKQACSFERIYFSRGTDIDIYRERKKLGKFLAPAILKAIGYDLENTVFSYIPNTAVDAYYGLIEALNEFCDGVKAEKIRDLRQPASNEEIMQILKLKPRVEKVAVKDVKLRTFITQDTQRDDLAAHVYDITYGSIRRGKDTLVVLDDSIVRGTTLKQSIIRILDRLEPVRIIIASSAPQIRYPDCYGIDMAKLTDFIAFKAAIELIYESHQKHIINEVYLKCRNQEHLSKEKIVNFVKEIYKPFTVEQISDKISALLTPPSCGAKIQIIFQSIENLHEACPGNTGDWYFTGRYPTPGGNKVVNQAFLNYIEGKNIRAYG